MGRYICGELRISAQGKEGTNPRDIRFSLGKCFNFYKIGIPNYERTCMTAHCVACDKEIVHRIRLDLSGSLLCRSLSQPGDLATNSVTYTAPNRSAFLGM